MEVIGIVKTYRDWAIGAAKHLTCNYSMVCVQRLSPAGEYTLSRVEMVDPLAIHIVGEDIVWSLVKARAVVRPRMCSSDTYRTLRELIQQQYYH